MKIEDALLACTLDAAALEDLPSWCEAAAAGGVDAVEVVPAAGQGVDRLRAAVAASRAADILCFVRGDARLAAEVAADGVVLSGADAAIGEARVWLGRTALAACRVASVDEARLAATVGADFIVADAAAMGVGAVNALRATTAAAVYAAVGGMEAAADAVSAGVVRLWIAAAAGEASRGREELARYARLLGRCV